MGGSRVSICSADAGMGHGFKPRILGQDRRLKSAQIRRWFDTKLSDQCLASLLVGGQRFCLAARPVKSEHQLCPQALSQRMATDGGLQLTDDRAVIPERQLGVDAILECRQVKLVEQLPLSFRPALRKVDQRRAPPQVQGPGQGDNRRGSVSTMQRGSTLPRHRSKAFRIYGVRRSLKYVTTRLGNEHPRLSTRRAIRLEDATKSSHICLEGIRCPVRRAPLPELVDQPFRRED